MTYIATESILWCIERCERETNDFSRIAVVQLTALEEQNEELRKAATHCREIAIKGQSSQLTHTTEALRLIDECLKTIPGQEEDKIHQRPTGTPDFEFLLKASRDLYELAVRRLPGCSLPGCLVCTENKEILKTAAKAIHQAEEVHYE